jgi:raffinose/stachyose/melibiose transport system permease protein
MNKLTQILRYLVLAVALVLFGFPLLWMFATAFREEGAAMERPFALWNAWTMANVKEVFTLGGFGKAYANSLLICGGSVAIAVCLSALAAYALAQIKFRLRTAIAFLFVLGLMIPVHVTLLPLNRLLGPNGLDIRETIWVLLGPYVAFSMPISIIILRNAFRNVPRDLLDCARLDGCSTWQVFFHVALPLVRPALSTVVIFNVLTLWNEFAFALALVSSETAQTIPLAVWQFKGEHGMVMTTTCAALLTSVVPLLIVYVIAQRSIIRGLTSGALKNG